MDLIQNFPTFFMVEKKIVWECIHHEYEIPHLAFSVQVIHKLWFTF